MSWLDKVFDTEARTTPKPSASKVGMKKERKIEVSTQLDKAVDSKRLDASGS